ncbi:MAG TPA: glycosyltransferase family 39 protein [Solirubrobacteraceae bacterium]|nr:glycosyltransferase family 39 protein [Solirubrobacteraceae bacterium]
MSVVTHPVAHRSRSSPRLDPRDAAVLLLPTLLAAALTLIDLTGRSLGFDEGATVAIVSQHGAALGRALARDGGNMSGYYLLMHVLVGAFGDGPWVLRLPSLVFAALTPGLVAAVALVLWRDRRVAAVAALLCAVSLPLVYWGQTARGYAAMTCLACASMLAFLRFAAAGAEGRRWQPAALGWLLATTAAAYCGFIVVLIVPVQVIGLMLVRDRRVLARFAGMVVALIILCVPLIVLAERRGSGQLFWVPRPNHQVDTQVMQSLTASGLQSTFHRVFLTTSGWIATSVVLLGLIGFGVWQLTHDRRRDRLAAWPAQLLFVWIVVPGLLTFLVSLVAQPIFQPRNLLPSFPAVALALGLALCDRRLPRWLATVALGLALLIRVVPLAAAYDVSPEPWQAVSARVLAASRPGDCITFYPEDGRNAFRWYLQRAAPAVRERAPRSVLPAASWSVTTPFVEIYDSLSRSRIATLRASCRRMWLVSSHEGQQAGPPEAIRHRREWLSLRSRLQHAFGRGPRWTDGWASAIHVELMERR